jgi:2-keto-4-pentenoate hydratase/2-oxohepta-3-ene-1,7-dioic acid hydratase in catechol pathway
MRLLSFELSGRASWGAYANDGNVIDLGAAFGDTLPTLRDYLAAEAATQAKVAAHVDGGSRSADIAEADITYLPTVPNAGKIIGIGFNYQKHAAETGLKVPEYPIIFARWHESHVGHKQPLLAPKESEQYDYEGELAVIIGKPARRIRKAEALSCVGGYSIYNDGSVRDWQYRTSQFTPGKNFVNSGSFGPCMTTADEIPDPAALHLTTRFNGDVVQDEGIDDLIFDVPHLISFVSTFVNLEPGDTIATGTPSGVGMARDPQLWMKPGDTVEIEISKIGTLSNPVAAG